MINTKDLLKRCSFALWAAPAGWWVINSTMSLIPKSAGTLLPAQVAVFLIIGIACYEYITLLTAPFPKNGFWLSYLWVLPLLGLELFGFDIPLKYAIFVLLLLVAFETIMWGEKNSGKWKRASLLFIGMVFLYIAGTSMLNLYDYPFQSFFRHNLHPLLSQPGVFTVIMSVFMCDTGAYFVGNFWGKHRYSSISPNKTIEGSIGGFAVAVIVCLLCWNYWGNHTYSWLVGIGMSVVIGIAAQVGDLMVSLIKRNFRVKNASDLIPGHGGVLDRFGSVFFTAPALGLFFWIAGKFAS